MRAYLALIASFGVLALGIIAYFFVRPHSHESTKGSSTAENSKEYNSLDGSWKVVSLDGVSPEKGKQVIYTFERGKLIVTLVVDSKEETLEETYQVDDTKDPKTINMTTTIRGSRSINGKSEQWSKKDNLHGIYDVQDENLRVCLTRVDHERPKKFLSDAKEGAILFLCERLKK
jgi:uncharacterized protein (TIGR03067 family)